MKLTSVVKYIYNNIDYKYLFPVSTYFGSYCMCASLLSKASNSSLFCGEKHGFALALTIFI